MKKPSNRDLAILAISLFLGILIGWAVCSIWNSRKEPVTAENPVNIQLKKSNDSLEAVAVSRKIRIDELQTIVTHSDSTILKTNKTLTKHYGKYEALPDGSKHNFVDSLLKVAGKR